MRYKRQYPLHVNNFNIDNVWTTLLTQMQTSQTFESIIDYFSAFHNIFMNFSQHQASLVITEEGGLVLPVCEKWQLHEKLYYEPLQLFLAFFRMQNGLKFLLKYVRQNQVNPYRTADQLLNATSNLKSKLQVLCLLPLTNQVSRSVPYIKFPPFQIQIPITIEELFDYFELNVFPKEDFSFTLPEDFQNYNWKAYSYESLIKKHFITHTLTDVFLYHSYVVNMYPKERIRLKKDKNGRYYISIGRYVFTKNGTRKIGEQRLYFEIDEKSKRPKLEKFIQLLERWINLHQWMDNPNQLQRAIQHTTNLVLSVAFFLTNKLNGAIADNVLFIGWTRLMPLPTNEYLHIYTYGKYGCCPPPYRYTFEPTGTFAKNYNASFINEVFYEQTAMRLYFLDRFLL